MNISYLHLFLVLNIFFNSPAKAGYSYFHSKKEDMQLTRESFIRYVRPQSRSIVQEYYHLLKKLDPVHANLIQTKNLISDIRNNWSDWERSCFKMNPECEKSLKVIYQQNYKLELLLFAITDKGINLKQAYEQNKLDSFLMLSGSLDKIRRLNYQLLHSLEETLITSQTSYERYNSTRSIFNKHIHEMGLASEIIITSQVSKSYKKDFDFIWVSFISKLDRYIVKKKNLKFLLSNLEDLNISWNAFHMKMAKGNKGLPKAQVKLIGIMHNRWNSILKMILRK
jgi:hypothetical protein